jgi:hypothetical protein
MIDAVEHQCCKVVEQKDKKMIDPQEITSATYPLKVRAMNYFDSQVLQVVNHRL